MELLYLQGAAVGMACSFILMMALGLASQVAKSQGFVHNQIKPFNVLNCPTHLNDTIFNHNSSTSALVELMAEIPAAETTAVEEIQEINFLLRISYLWYTLMGFIIALVVGTLVSFMTGYQDPSKLDPKLVWPFLRSRVGLKRV